MKNMFAVLSSKPGSTSPRLETTQSFSEQSKAERFASSAQAVFIRKNDADIKRGGYYEEPPTYFIMQVVSVIQLPVAPVEAIKPSEAVVELDGSPASA